MACPGEQVWQRLDGHSANNYLVAAMQAFLACSVRHTRGASCNLLGYRPCLVFTWWWQLCMVMQAVRQHNCCKVICESSSFSAGQ